MKRFIKNFASTGVDLLKVDEYADKYMKLIEGMEPTYTEYRKYNASLAQFDVYKDQVNIIYDMI